MSKEKSQYEIEKEFIEDISEGYFEDNELEIEMKELYSTAYELAKKVHSDQKRDDGSPYMTHIDGIIDILTNEFNGSQGITILITAVLHDVLEDSEEITYEYLKSKFGSVTADEVRLLTKDKGSSVEDYLKKIESYKHSRTLIRIKLADRLHNVRSLKLITLTRPDKVKRYIEETVKFYLPLSQKYGILLDQLNTALSELK